MHRRSRGSVQAPSRRMPARSQGGADTEDPTDVVHRGQAGEADDDGRSLAGDRGDEFIKSGSILGRRPIARAPPWK